MRRGGGRDVAKKTELNNACLENFHYLVIITAGPMYTRKGTNFAHSLPRFILGTPYGSLSITRCDFSKILLSETRVLHSIGTCTQLTQI